MGHTIDIFTLAIPLAIVFTFLLVDGGKAGSKR